MNESIKLANENELQEQTLIANGNLRELTFSPQTKYLILPIEWQEIELESLFGFVIGGDWGKDCDFEHIDFVDAFCIRGSEFKHWDKYRGASASLRKIKHSSLQTRQLRLDDILIEISGGGPDQPVGRTVIIDERVINQFVGKQLVCTNFLRLARPIVNVDSTFLNYYLKCFYLSGEVIKYQAGSNNLRNLKFKEYSQIFIPLPPLAEQQQIAAKLDELLAQVDNLKTRLDNIPKILKRFRQSVLAAAVSGKMTEDWRIENLISEGDWRETKIGKLVKSIEAGKNLKCIETPPVGDQHGIIKISAVTWGIYDENESKTLPDHKLFVESRRIKSGDFLISRANTLELIGMPVIVKDVLKNLMLSDKVWRLVMNEADKMWLSIFLRSYFGRKEIESRSTGNQLSMRNIGQKTFLDINLPKPSIEEQTEIVARVEQLFTYADQIEQRVKDAQSRVNHLTQAILAKAFRGELTAEWRVQNPELISGENSAEALLSRIKAEREMVVKPKKTGKKTKA